MRGPFPACTRLMPGLAGLMLAGCTLTPAYQRPAPPVPERFPVDTAAAASDAATLADQDWRAFFREPELQALIGEALANNRDLRMAAARLEQARANWRIEGASLYPHLDAVGTATRGRTPADLSLVGVPVTGNKFYAQLSAGWEIDFWGRLRALRDAAREQYLASEEGRRGVATSLVAQIAANWLLDADYAERIALARDSIDTREESLRILRRRYEVGSGNKLDMTQAQTLLAQARTALEALEQERAVNRNALALLVGHPVDPNPSPLGLAAAEPNQPLPAGLPSSLLERRPDIMAAEHQLRAANAQIGVARAAFFPNISLTGAWGTASADLDGLFKGGSSAWNVSPTLSLPLFNAGHNRANLSLAEARQVEAVANYEKTVQTAFRDVADALVNRQQLLEQARTVGEMVDALRERARLAQLRFDNGRSAYLEVLDAQRDLFDAQQTLVQLRRGYLASGVSLYSALGGGFPANRPNTPGNAARTTGER